MIQGGHLQTKKVASRLVFYMFIFDFKRKGAIIMKLFGLKKRSTESSVTKGEFVKVLGSGCAKCHQLEANVKIALKQLGMDTAVEHVTDFAQIAAYGVMSTPALVVDGKVISYGKVLKVEEAVKLLEKI
jgi:small redox-active disulfide protein 2